MPFDMDTKEIITVLAIIAGPILAVQAQKWLEAVRYKKQRRLNLFHTLMSTRATRLSIEHVSALNMIDIEFYGRKVFGIRFQTPKEKAVTNAWKNYNDRLIGVNPPPDQQALLFAQRDDAFIAMLYGMSKALGYDFDEVQLKRDCYRPAGHGDLEADQYMIRKGILDILNGTRAMPVKQFVEPTPAPEPEPDQQEQDTPPQ